MHFHLYQFNPDFDLLTGELPKDLLYDFGDQVQRARHILKGRTSAEIEYALSSLDWMLQVSSQKLLFRNLEEDEGKPFGTFLTSVKALKLLVDEIDISEQGQLPNATWPEYFSVFALALISELLCQETLDKLDTSSEVGQALHEYMASQGGYAYTKWVTECTESICYAEHLIEMDQLANNTIKKEMSARGKKGRKKRSAPFDTLYEKLLKVYDEKYYCLSNRKAAIGLYSEFSEEIDSVLETDDPEKQLEKVIARHKKRKENQAS